jgi:HEAT repeat protein
MRRSIGMALTALLLTAFGCNSAPRPVAPLQPLPPAPAPLRAGAVVEPALRASARKEFTMAVGSTYPTIRVHALEGLKDSLGASARSEIVAALVDPDPVVRFAAAMAAGELRLPQARPELLKLVSDTEVHVQIGAIFALHRLGDVRYSAGLEEALKSPQPDVRANAAFALGRLGERSALKILRPLLRDHAMDVRLQVAEAMWRLGDEDGLSFLVAAGLNRYPEYQMVALLALAGPRDPRVIQHVRVCLETEVAEVRLVAARAMGMLNSDEGFTIAVQGASSADMRQRYLAALALGAIGRPDGQEALGTLLYDPEGDVRVAAATGILQLR